MIGRGPVFLNEEFKDMGALAPPSLGGWEIATHREDLAADEMLRRGREATAHMQPK